MTDNKKDSNPKDALGVKKVPLHAVPVKPLLEVGLAMMEGGRKYGTHNYRAIGVRMSTYYNAAMRHLMAWWEGEDTDKDSGVPHLVKAMASLFVVRDGILMGNCVDDRPIRYPDGIDMEKFNNLAADMITKYPECAKAFTMHSDIKAAGPRFKPGDIVKIKLQHDVEGDINERLKKVNHTGVYDSPINRDMHNVDIGDELAMPFFYTEELTLMEDN